MKSLSLSGLLLSGGDEGMQKILIVAEGSIRFNRLQNMIKNGQEETVICRCSSMSEAAETIRSEGADVIVADVSSSIAEGDGGGKLPFSPTKGNAKQDLGYIKQYIRDHYNESINNSKLAAIIHLTPNYLCTLFKKEEKMTVRAYIEKVRLERAVFLLLTDDMSISDISTEVGYKQPSYFCRVFRDHYHETPSEYRENRKSIGRNRRNG